MGNARTAENAIASSSHGSGFAGNISALLVIAPHPDDEVLGCGWLMREVTRHQGQVVLAWLTDGSASHGPAADCAKLARRRRAEAAAGLAALGVIPVACYWLGARDGRLAEFATPHANAAWLAAICARHGIDSVAVTAGDDSHPDHRAAFALAQLLTVRRRYAYPVSARYDGELPNGSGVRPDALTIGPFADPAKRRALACHASQAPGEGALSPLSRNAVDRFCSEAEVFYPMEA